MTRARFTEEHITGVLKDAQAGMRVQNCLSTASSTGCCREGRLIVEKLERWARPTHDYLPRRLEFE